MALSPAAHHKSGAPESPESGDIRDERSSEGRMVRRLGEHLALWYLTYLNEPGVRNRSGALLRCPQESAVLHCPQYWHSHAAIRNSISVVGTDSCWSSSTVLNLSGNSLAASAIGFRSRDRLIFTLARRRAGVHCAMSRSRREGRVSIDSSRMRGALPMLKCAKCAWNAKS